MASLEVARTYGQEVLSLITAILKSPVFKGVKWSLYALVLLNIRSFPLAWHWRVWEPVTIWRLKYLWLTLRTLLSSKRVKELELERWFDSLAPIGTHPFKLVTKYKNYASIDESDFNIHLSNSSYPKNLDRARFDAAVVMFPQFLRLGGKIPLAGVHSHFIREIPMLSGYEIRTSVGAWDEKWCYVISKFVSHQKPKKRVTSAPTPTKDEQKAPSEADGLFRVAVATPADETSTTNTPLPATTPSIQVSAPDTAADLKAIASKLMLEEDDGATLHTVCVSQVCFKIGRITVPPAIVFALDGMSRSPEAEGAQAFSKSNPPPHWADVQKLLYTRHGGNIKKGVAFLKGAWKDIPEGERWWEQAMSGEVETLRKARLEAVSLIKSGMENARKM